MNKIWQELRGDARRVGLWLLLAMVAVGSLRYIPWGGMPGDLLSIIGFELILMVVLVHVLRRIAIPLQLLDHAREAKEKGNVASAIVYAATVGFMGVLLIALVLLFIGSVSKVQAAELPPGLPANAYRNLPIVMAEQARFWPDHPSPSVLGAQAEQETCPSLKSKTCWSERAELKTARERGVGLGQATKTARFDSLTEAKQRYGKLLAGWSWAKPYNAVYQARALVLHDKRCYAGVSGAAEPEDQLAMAFNCYNAGPGMLAKSRMACAAADGCDPSRWFGNVELAGGPARKVAVGYTKSFYDISREYVKNVMVVRRARYRFLDQPGAA